jgi:membrane protein YdbS with pleckstrin-like domain
MARRSLLSMLLPTPDQIVRSYLTTDESIILIDQPSTNAFIVEASKELILIGVVVLITIAWVGAGGSSTVAAIGFIVLDLLLIYLIIKRMQFWYTRYVLTDFRVIRSWGILKRQMAWIPWAKVTDISMTQSLLGRLLGYATVRIESANEDSGFKEIKDLRQPHRFHRVIGEMVEAKQGKTRPFWTQTPGAGASSPPSDVVIND